MSEVGPAERKLKRGRRVSLEGRDSFRDFYRTLFTGINTYLVPTSPVYPSGVREAGWEKYDGGLVRVY